MAATQAARRPGPLRAWFRGVQQRKGKKIARVALARRLAEIAYHVWKDDVDYWTIRRHGVVLGELGSGHGLRTAVVIGQPVRVKNSVC